MLKDKAHSISLLVANRPGVLVRIALVFSRRGYNIDSLVVSPTLDPNFSRMNIIAHGNPEILMQIIKQLEKLVDVVQAKDHTDTDAVFHCHSLLHSDMAGTEVHQPRVVCSVRRYQRKDFASEWS